MMKLICFNLAMLAVAMNVVYSAPTSHPHIINNDNAPRNDRLFDGDEILTDFQRENIELSDGERSDNRVRRNTAISLIEKWKNAVIPYHIDSTKVLNLKKYRKVIIGALNILEEETCLKFIERTTQKNYISFNNEGGCSSNIGMTGNKQKINIQEHGCLYDDLVIHEVMHSLGFWHEHQRPDRDQYVTILWENVQKEKDYNFKIVMNWDEMAMSEPYDVTSVMQYQNNYFSNSGRATIERKNKPSFRLGGLKLTEHDAKEINNMYCGGKTPVVRPKPAIDPDSGSGVVSASKTTAKPTTNNCYNKIPFCQYIVSKKDYHCQFPHYLELCPVSCEACGAEVKLPTTTPTTTTTTTTTPTTKTTTPTTTTTTTTTPTTTTTTPTTTTTTPTTTTTTPTTTTTTPTTTTTTTTPTTTTTTPTTTTTTTTPTTTTTTTTPTTTTTTPKTTTTTPKTTTTTTTTPTTTTTTPTTTPAITTKKRRRKTTTTTAAPSIVEEVCEDLASDCKYISRQQQHNYCPHPYYRKKCAKTCGYCGKASRNSHFDTNKECRDSGGDFCRIIDTKPNYCKHFGFRQTICRKSCGACDDVQFNG